MTNDTHNHPSADELLLLAYGELPQPRAADVEAHVAGCAGCHAQLAELDRARVAVDWAVERPRRSRRWVAVVAGGALAAAAVLAGILLTTRRPSDTIRSDWPPRLEWSATAGYVAGGPAMVEIDKRLTRLEQEWHYGWPN